MLILSLGQLSALTWRRVGKYWNITNKCWFYRVETESRVYKVLTRGLNRAHLGHAQTQALYGIKPWVNSLLLVSNYALTLML